MNYAIGDIQGCYQPLQELLAAIAFNPAQDRLWLVGDLVNRGPQSLEVLRFISQLATKPIIVLGNHDLHLLAVHSGVRRISRHDTFQDVLAAEDADELCDWLRQQPLIYHDKALAVTMVHAGIPAQWSLQDALHFAQEAQQVLQSEQHAEFFQHMYGNQPALWNDNLEGWDRLRLIINYFTRMRFCTELGELNLKSKTGPTNPPPGTKPWFAVSDRKTHDDTIIFGHWAALEGKAETKNIYALDTGCVWGGQLTAMRLEDRQLFSVPGLSI